MSVSGELRAAVCAVALATSFGCTPALAKELTDQVSSEANASISKSVQDESSAQVDERREALIDDATLALEKTEEALTFLDDGDTQAALDALAIATGKLETVVARDPDLALAPVSVRLIQRDLLGDVESIEIVRNAIVEFVELGQIQQARPLLRGFASEIIIETTNLPLATYPSSILRATAQIDDGATEDAKKSLATALSTVVVTEEVIALPVLRAERFIDAAEAALGEEPVSTSDGGSSGATSIENETADEVPKPALLTPGGYVQAAREQLDLAAALGYGEADDFAELRDDLKQLDEKIDDKKDAGGILNTIRDSGS